MRLLWGHESPCVNAWPASTYLIEHSEFRCREDKMHGGTGGLRTIPVRERHMGYRLNDRER